ncbi:hypothetical protein FD06_GL000291 [Apilactobacillus ozensis DSM 23829 = JCM 17196]|uniref:Uncharacterized protein n=1 Tax=Apilactobacillus ozensis DSM 23829 = JCM 17196 TaxID=1423781 RepID=A0A0R2AR03_9LACO|nr:hypothetical protein [Apilactobacillus ozensis]KRM69232.1 hypothetical protein FD06_GL000291 [Apilactobacillus ozensis DSM 23829 = JCM 17196]
MNRPKGFEYWHVADNSNAGDDDEVIGYYIDSNAPDWAKQEFEEYKQDLLDERITY